MDIDENLDEVNVDEKMEDEDQTTSDDESSEASDDEDVPGKILNVI